MATESHVVLYQLMIFSCLWRCCSTCNWLKHLYLILWLWTWFQQHIYSTYAHVYVNKDNNPIKQWCPATIISSSSCRFSPLVSCTTTFDVPPLCQIILSQPPNLSSNLWALHRSLVCSDWEEVNCVAVQTFSYFCLRGRWSVFWMASVNGWREELAHSTK